MNNKYIDAFLECVTWEFKKSDIMIMEKEEVCYSDLFIETFPKLNILLNKAITFRIVLKNNSCFRLICWENNEAIDSIGGWLCQNCTYINTELPHLNLLKNFIGTIIESWGFESTREDLLDDTEGVLIDNVTYGIGNDWKNYFQELCDCEQVFPQIQDEDYIVIGEDTSGNLTLCNKNNEEIVLFATDHDFDYAEVYPDCPDYTFHKIKNVNGLVDYFELIAQQWLTYLE